MLHLLLEKRHLEDRVLITQLSSHLLFHPVKQVQLEILKFGYGFKTNRMPTDTAIPNITRAYRDYIRKMFSAHSFKPYSRQLICHQCDDVRANMGGQPWHELWETQCDKHMVVVNLECAGLSAGHKPSIINDIEILRTLSKSASHPHIPRLLGYYTAVPRFYMVESLETTFTLTELLQRHRDDQTRLTPFDLLQNAILPLVSAVSYCHDQNIVLRNVTAAALLARDMGTTFTVKLNAFHLARICHRKDNSRSKLSYYGKYDC